MSGKSKGNKKRTKRQTNNLVALGSAAVLAVYSAGFARTRASAQRFSDDSSVRGPMSPGAAGAEPRASSAALAVSHTAAATESPPSAPGSARQAANAAAMSPNTPSPTATPAVDHATTVSHSSTKGDSTSHTHGDATAVQTAAQSALPAAPSAPVLPTTPAVDSAPSKPAPAQAEAPAPPPAAPAKAKVGWTDGVYYGWGTSRHGDIQAEVEIKGGRIASAVISQCLTRYSCSWISALPGQVLARQSPEVDYVSGATQSTNAFYYAVVDALLKAK